MLNPLSLDWGWACILQARAVDWSAHSGTSFAIRGIEVEIRAGGGWRCAVDLESQAAALLDMFLPWVCRSGEYAIAQIGQSLDGRIATESGASRYINGVEARAHLHRLRAIVDAVVVGVGTVNADDPQLTVRHVEGRNPCRVVLDPRGRANSMARLFHDGQAPTLYVTGPGVAPAGCLPHGSVASPVPLAVVAHPSGDTLAVPRQEGVRHSTLDVDGGRFDPAAVLALLRAHGCRRVLVEGGGFTVSRFLQAGALDRLHVMVAPMLIGSGRPGLMLPPIEHLDDALQPACRTFPCGADILFDVDLRASPAALHTAPAAGRPALAAAAQQGRW